MKKECGARAASILMTLLMLFAGSASGWADEIDVRTSAELNLGFTYNTVDIINVTEDITDACDLHINKSVTINLNGHSISGNYPFLILPLT